MSSDYVLTTFFNSNTISRDLYQAVVGKKLGSGVARAVYVYKPDPTCVIKFETGRQSFQNVKEWDVWDHVKEVKAIARWFAPVMWISENGAILVQKRVAPLDPKRAPLKVPACFTDLKYSNWGLLKGHPVCVDYGLTRFISEGISTRLQKADWWGEEWEPTS